MGAGSDLWSQFQTLLNKQDWVGAASLFDRDAVYVSPTGSHEGRDAIGAYFDEMGRTSSVNVESSLVIEDGDTVVAEWTDRTTVTEPVTLPDGTQIVPTGKPMELAGVTVATVRDGNFATMHEYFDSAALMSQLSG